MASLVAACSIVAVMLFCMCCAAMWLIFTCVTREVAYMSYAIVDATCADICVARLRLLGVGHQVRSFGSWYN